MMLVKGIADLGAEWIDDHRHQRGHRGDHGREEVDEACRFVGDDVFFKDELQQVCERLQHAAVADAVWTKASLDQTEHATLGQHGVGDDQKHDRERHGDGYELEGYIDRSVHVNCLSQFTRIRSTDCDLIQRRNRSRLGTRIAGGEQLKLSDFLRQRPNRNNSVPTSGVTVILSPVIRQRFNMISNAQSEFPLTSLEPTS